MIFVYFRGIFLPGAFDGLYYLFVPDFGKLFDLSIWIAAGNQVFYLLNISFGANIYVAKYRSKSDRLYNSSLFVVWATVIIGLLTSVINFCYLGHLSHQTKVPIDKLPLGGCELAFVTYPAAISLLPFPNLWALLFFFMLITLGIDSQVIRILYSS